MLPSVLARQYQEGLIDYIDTTFPMTNPIFKDSLKKMLETKGSVFHEPYVAVRLPFRVYEGEDNTFEAINQPYSPYVHQHKAFERLTGEDGRSTLVATGTGSGKTECFLYPILEYCYQHRGEPGIKALIIYPMNALASDQAKRIAELVDSNPKLKNNNIRVGMYVGGAEQTSAKIMMPDKVITDKETLLAAPPDILMTNYKMLDYLLVRPKDAELWKNNSTPDTLKYIAVDELHTFDGAQGTDLACLLRRLKARLSILPGQLCCIGTSATMGSKDSSDSIRQYAADVFGEEFEDDSIITEDRLSPREFFDGYGVEDYKMPSRDEAALLRELSQGEDEEEYLRQALKAWFDAGFSYSNIMSDETRVQIGQHLMKHNFTQSLIYEAKGAYIQTDALIEILGKRFPDFAEMPDENVKAVIDAIYALISHARIRTDSGAIRPFLNVQVQLWMRELRRLVAKVDNEDITYALAGDLNEQQSKHYLPVVNCRDCGETGWASLEDNGCVELRDLNTFYNLFFNCDTKVRMIFPVKERKNAPYYFNLCPECMDISFSEGNDLCSNGHNTIPVWIPDLKVNGKGRGKSFECPFCGSKGGLSIMGLRSATAISAGISELYASKFNDDKKLLAFTDNVQDASHHAGFYNSRTWRFGLRTAITRFADLIDTELSLDEFIRSCSAYWRNYMGDEAFVANFIPQGLTWMRAYQKMVEDGYLRNDEDANSLKSYVDERLRYEILLEYGMTSRIGRSLEKAGCSVLSFDIDKAIPRIMDRIPNEVGTIQSADVDTFYKLTMGLLYQMKLNGAFDYYVYGSFIEQNGSDYLISSKFRRWMPGPRKGRNVPKFVAVNKGGKLGYFDEPNNKSIYGKWTAKYLPFMHMDSDPTDVNKIILEELVNSGILVKPEGPKDIDVYAINTEKVMVSKNVKQMICDECGTGISVSDDNAYIWEGACCTRPNCCGHFRVNPDSGLDFYGKLYSQGELIRIVAKEHTGLLERDDREELERLFKKKKEDKKPWDANLLSCTPTLEMGIDIGDLSTVILSSIPPTQSNYAQRAGRGGRKDGNALTIAIANAKPHDLYFYEDPMEMIAGSVTPPKVFLKASAVLSRQFVAFCMDCWVKTGKAEMPKDVGACLAKLDDTATDRFPNNFMSYVQTNLTKLVRTFINTFSANLDGSGGLDTNAIEDIKRFAMGDQATEESMAFKIYHEFRELKDQRTAIQDNLKELRKMIKELEEKPEDSSYEEQLKELRAELSAWSRVVYGINSKDVFGFLADSGLLPNYAFPEAGIVLKAIITRSENDPENEGKKKYESTSYEYTRAASAAISEFAPLNSFYAGGHKLTIDQVDVNTAKSEPWRLCPNCSHAEIENAGNPSSTCPKCGSTGWADNGQVRNMFKVSMVYSNVKEEESIIGDDSDDRTSMFFDKEMLVEVDEDKDVIQAFQMDNDEFSFGYEFVKKATMREINFGEQDIVGDKMAVAGREGIRKGFTICKYCGKIQIEHEQPKHSRFCKVVKDKTAVISSDNYEECLFLYREFNTEALRLLIPATTMDATGVRQESFVAAFMLGMKSYFGNVDHLNATISEVPVPDADYRKQYLVIYDTVPGGTGYLKQLMNDRNGIEDVLQRALDIMEGCSCKDDPQKDGCYKCLYAYRQSRHIGEISRRTAVNLIKTILSGKENKKEIKKLANVDANHLFDSELERRFVGAFERLSTAERPIQIHKQLVNDKEGYSLQVGTSLWSIEPQVDFDESMGITVASKPDFVIRAKRTVGDQKPIAIFTDGYQFHNNIVEKDTKKRMAIMLSGKYRVWSLTWNDVESIYKDKDDYKTGTLTSERMPFGAKYTAAINRMGAGTIRPGKENSFELLIDYLAYSDAERLFGIQAKAYAMAIVDNSSLSNQMLYSSWENGWKSILSAINSTNEPDRMGNAIAGKWLPRNEMGNVEVYAEVAMDDMQLKGMDATFRIGVIINDNIDTRTDKFQQDWNGFWHFVNVMQFAGESYFLSIEGMRSAIYTSLGSIVVDQEPDVSNTSSEVVIDNKWKTYIDEDYFIDDLARTCATEMMNNGIPAPSDIGYELEGANGAAIAECEMAWADRKIAWLLPEQEADNAEVFKSSGWTVLYSSEHIDINVFGGTANE